MPADTKTLVAQRLYARLPEFYRARDIERAIQIWGQEPVSLGDKHGELYEYLAIVAEQVAALHDNIGDLWDDFFVETCADWAVPYLADLLGVNLIYNAGQRNRVDLANTVDWRRRKGTLDMLRDLAADITGWGAGAVEFFERMGWSQNLNHLRLFAAQSPDLRDPYPLRAIATARDAWQHAADVRLPSQELGWYNTRNIGFFLSRLQLYPLRGVEPVDATGAGRCFTFDSLGRDVPLFDGRDRNPIAAQAFAAAPDDYFGRSTGFAVKQFGVLAASDRPPPAAPTQARDLCKTIRTLSATAGIQLLEPDRFAAPMRSFVITAFWRPDAGAPVRLGALSSFKAYRAAADAFVRTGAGTGAGVLMLRLQLGRPRPDIDPGWSALPESDPAFFPATVISIRDDTAHANRRAADTREGRYKDALLIYLPQARLNAGQALDLYVTDDGATYYALSASGAHTVPDTTTTPGSAPERTPALMLDASGTPDRTFLARAGSGQVFPPRGLSYTLAPFAPDGLHRVWGMRAADQSRFASGGRPFAIEARIMDAAQLPDRPDKLVGTLPTYTDAAAGYTAFSFAPGATATFGGGTLVLKVRRRPGAADAFFPMCEIVLMDRTGAALVAYLPEIDFTTTANPAWLYIAGDGASFWASGNFGRDSLLEPIRGAGGAFFFDPATSGAGLARKSAGNILPRQGALPLAQRVPVYCDLCDWNHPHPGAPRPGQLAIDPERGRFCFAVGDAPPAPARATDVVLACDLLEAFPGDVGARAFDRYLSLKDAPPTQVVARGGDADTTLPIYATLAAALAAAPDGAVIQIADSCSYRENLALNSSLGARGLRLQAANRQRPTLIAANAAQPALAITAPQAALEINGMLISGQVRVTAEVKQLNVIGCTIDPLAAQPALLVADDAPDDHIVLFLCRAISGALRLGAAVDRLSALDSILDRAHNAVGGAIALDPADDFVLRAASAPAAAAQAAVQLERTTLFGRGWVRQLFGSEIILFGLFTVADRQAGCLRYSRYQPGSVLPRRFQCVPNDNDLSASDPVIPIFTSRRFGSPAYAQLALVCPERIRSGAENGSEMGAFQGARVALREKNLRLKLDEYLPVGLTAALIYVT